MGYVPLQNQTYLLQVNPFTKYVNFTVPVKITAASRFVIMGKRRRRKVN